MELISPTEFAKETVKSVQDYSLLAAQSVANLFRKPRYFADMIQQADLIGFGSLPIIVLTGLSIGAELALNSANTLQRFGSLSLIGQLVSVGMVRELGPDHHRVDGCRQKRFWHGQRTGFHGGDRTN